VQHEVQVPAQHLVKGQEQPQKNFIWMQSNFWPAVHHLNKQTLTSPSTCAIALEFL
jgi:hypothetical protein